MKHKTYLPILTLKVGVSACYERGWLKCNETKAKCETVTDCNAMMEKMKCD